MRNLGLLLFVLAALFGAAAGCTTYTYTPTSPGSASPSASPSGSPLPCATYAAGANFIAMGSEIAPVTAPTYGVIGGYSLVDSTGSYPVTAQPIVLKPGDMVQFSNVDPANIDGSNGNPHSAVGFKATAFPTPGYTFPPGVHSPVGTAITNLETWSTGDIPSEYASVCYSRVYIVPAVGTYYFGDANFFSTGNMRDVLVSSLTASQAPSGAVRPFSSLTPPWIKRAAPPR